MSNSRYIFIHFSKPYKIFGNNNGKQLLGDCVIALVLGLDYK